MDPRQRPLDSRRILVVDDQPSIRGLLARTLEEAGATVAQAENGSVALDLIGAELPDLVLLDLSMPGLDGWQTLERLKADRETARIPVVLETSAEDLASYTRARREHVAAFISKPFRLAEVVETCRRVLLGERPFAGTLPVEQEGAVALVRHAGRVLVGRLVEMDGRGAQVELSEALPTGTGVHLTANLGEAPVTREAEVRWVRNRPNCFQHGLALRG